MTHTTHTDAPEVTVQTEAQAAADALVDDVADYDEVTNAHAADLDVDPVAVFIDVRDDESISFAILTGRYELTPESLLRDDLAHDDDTRTIVVNVHGFGDHHI